MLQLVCPIAVFRKKVIEENRLFSDLVLDLSGGIGYYKKEQTFTIWRLEMATKKKKRRRSIRVKIERKH